MLLSFYGISRPVRLTDCEELADGISDILPDWPIRNGAESGSEPVITITKSAKGYRRTSPWLSKPAIYSDPINAVCDFIVDLISAYIADDPQLLCLHCAGIEFERGLVVFPNPYKAGKSTLSVFLAARGARLFADDVLPIKAPANQGEALGILPRLRLPLPDDAGRRFNAFVKSHAGAQSKRYLYVNLPEPNRVGFGISAPIQGIVFLNRDQKTPPALEPMSDSDAMKETIRRNFSRTLPALEILDRMQAVVEAAECYTLRYHTVEQAANLLGKTFGLKAVAEQDLSEP